MALINSEKFYARTRFELSVAWPLALLERYFILWTACYGCTFKIRPAHSFYPPRSLGRVIEHTNWRGLGRSLLLLLLRLYCERIARNYLARAKTWAKKERKFEYFLIFMSMPIRDYLHKGKAIAIRSDVLGNCQVPPKWSPVENKFLKNERILYSIQMFPGFLPNEEHKIGRSKIEQTSPFLIECHWSLARLRPPMSFLSPNGWVLCALFIPHAL